MRLLFILVTIALLSEGKKRRPKKKIKTVADDDLPHKADVYPERFIPVPFGHIFKEGFQPSLKLPVDLLELDRRYFTKPDTEEFVSTDKSIQTNLNEKPRELDSRKNFFDIDEEDKPVEDKIDINGKKDVEKDDLTKHDTKMWHDLATNHARNVANSRGSRPSHATSGRLSKNTNPNQAPPYPDNKHKEQFFSKSSFDLEVTRRQNKLYNWTTCDEFGRNANFHPNDIINIDWVPFYTWSPAQMRRTVSFVHRFSTPTIKLVQKYKEGLGSFVNKTLDWSSPKLHLKSNMEMLLIAVDRRGQFDGIPYHDVPKAMKQSSTLTLPLVSLRLKILDPYLAMMFCEFEYATMMAVSGNEPTNIKEIRAAAATLKLQGRGYPVVRDKEAERMAVMLERNSKMQIERDRFLDAKADDDFLE